MMACSDLISSITSALTHLDGVPAALELKIELRNLQMQLVISSRKFGDHLLPHPSRFSRIWSLLVHGLNLPPLISRIEAAIARILLQEAPSGYDGGDNIASLPEVRGFAKQLADACNTSALTVDDVVAIADSILENAADFWVLVSKYRWHRLECQIEFIDALAAQVTFLKCLLVLARGAGAQLQHLMIHFQPFAISAARVFIRDEPDLLDDWYEEVNFKCSVAIGVATAPQVYEAYTQALSRRPTSAPAGILDNFLDSLVSLLWDVLRRRTNSGAQDQLKVLYERLRFCRCVSKQKPGCFDGDQIGVLVCGAGMLVCSLHHKDAELSYPGRLPELLARLAVLQAQVENDASESTVAAVVELGSGGPDGNEETATSGHQPQRSSGAPQVAGFQDDEVNPVLDRLTRGSKQLQLVPICGMVGIGKTTFASALYNHRSIIYHFQSRAWCPVSQVLDKRKVMLHLLDQLIQKPENYSEYMTMTEDDIANKLRKSLKGKKYLIVLDDVWTTEAWHSLKASFPDDFTQSRIILTSRYRDVVPDQQPHLLRLRDDDECLDILQMKLSHNEGWTSEIGMTIAKMCKGLPLMAVIVAGLLASITKQQGWKGILDNLSSSNVSGEKQCKNALELSFKHLPDDLKLCFLYFAAFPEDEEIFLTRLIRLWIAEGFVRESESKRIEDVAREYMEILIQRSLVMVAQNRSIGGVKTCRIHDLIHEFCLRRAKQENLFHILSQRDDELSDFNEPPNLQRLIIHSDPIHFKNARLFCPRAHSMFLFSTAESTRFDPIFIIQIFKHLTVLDIRDCSFTPGIPTDIELLTHLRYLSFQSGTSVIPYSLGNLLNLETLIAELWSGRVIPFPRTFWNLHKLKCLCIKGSRFSLPTDSLDNSCALLETLSGVVFNSYSCMERQMRKFPNIRRLKCYVLHGQERTEHSNKVVISNFLNQLQCLTISGKGQLQCEFGLSKNLKRLSLGGFELSREEIANIGRLPNLEVLKLVSISFWSGTLDMGEEVVSKLRCLSLVNMRIKRWAVFDEQLPCLQKLMLNYFSVSEEIPSDCLKNSATIEEIQVRNCSPNVEDFAREIQEEQEDYGNLVNVDITLD